MEKGGRKNTALCSFTFVALWIHSVQRRTPLPLLSSLLEDCLFVRHPADSSTFCFSTIRSVNVFPSREISAPRCFYRDKRRYMIIRSRVGEVKNARKRNNGLKKRLFRVHGADNRSDAKTGIKAREIDEKKRERRYYLPVEAVRGAHCPPAIYSRTPL